MAPLVVPAVVGFFGYHEGRGILREFWISRGIFSFGGHEGDHARGLIFGILTNFTYNFQITFTFSCVRSLRFHSLAVIVCVHNSYVSVYTFYEQKYVKTSQYYTTRLPRGMWDFQENRGGRGPRHVVIPRGGPSLEETSLRKKW